jgi:hypothetical protein
MIGAFAPLALSTAALVLANLLPLAAVLAGWWSVYEVLLLFWAENVVIGLFNVARMLALLVLKREVAMLALIPFFGVHYGLFTFVHGMFVIGMLAPPEANAMQDGIALLLAPEGLLWPLAALAASHGFSFAANFLGAGEWRKEQGMALMAQPYGRVVVLHLVILAGGALVLALGEPVWALVLLVLLKIGVDLAAHRRAHRGAPPPIPDRRARAP